MSGAGCETTGTGIEAWSKYSIDEGPRVIIGISFSLHNLEKSRRKTPQPKPKNHGKSYTFLRSSKTFYPEGVKFNVRIVLLVHIFVSW